MNTTTIRQFCEEHDLDVAELAPNFTEEWLDAERTMTIGTSRSGSIYHRCGGGEVLFTFKYADRDRRRVTRPVHLVRDDEAGKRWDAWRRDNPGSNARPAEFPNGRPSPRLRFAQSA